MSIASPNLPQTGGRVATASPPAPRENPLQRWVAGLFGRRAFWVLFVLVAFSWPISRVIHRAMPPKLPVLGTIAAFELVDQTGHAFGTADLQGRVWVLSTIQTSSASAVDLAKELGKIQHRVRNLGQAFHLVTVGLDPVGDAPDRLLEFSGRYRVSPRIWSFLSGEPGALLRAQATIGLERDASGPLSVAVVDGKMQVRGRYDLADPTAIDTLLYHVGLLVNRGD